MNSNKKDGRKVYSIQNGEKFNRLTVISYTDRINKKGEYKCVCDCGNITYARTSSLKRGSHASCGCLMRETQAKRLTKPNNEAVYNFTYRNYKKSALKRNYEFFLTKEKFTELIQSNCEYCGSEPLKEFNDGNGRRKITEHNIKINGIDRVDNSIGYIDTNVVSCCYICNNSKNTLSKEEWLNWIKKVYNYQIK